MPPNDLREAKIIYQNALAHATRIEAHNASIDNRKIHVQDVIDTAKIIAREVLKLGKEK